MEPRAVLLGVDDLLAVIVAALGADAMRQLGLVALRAHRA